MATHRRSLVLEVAAFFVTLGGLAVLAHGVSDASPIVYAYTDAEREAARNGRELMLAGTVVLAVASLLLAARGRLLRALAVAAPAAICTPLAYKTDPGTGRALWSFLPLALVALVASVPRRRAPGER